MGAVLDAATRLVSGRSVILTAGAASSESLAVQMHDLGAREVHRLALRTQPSLGVWHQLSADDAALLAPSHELAARLDAIDPAAEAVVYTGSYTTCRSLLGRRVLGARRTAWADAECTLEQRRLVGRRVRPLDVDQLERLPGIAHLSQIPIVVSGIPRSGSSLGAHHKYLVVTTDTLERRDRLRAIGRTLSLDCEVALVARFDPGLPVTVYGYVAEQRVVMQPPVLALVFVDDATSRISAPGIVTFAALSDGQAAAAYRAARNAAFALVHQHDYRGAFGIDGSLRAEALVVHDINPRVCAGFRTFDRHTLGGAHPSLVDMVLRESGRPADIVRELPDPLAPRGDSRVVVWDSQDAEWQALASLQLDGWTLEATKLAICHAAGRGRTYLGQLNVS